MKDHVGRHLKCNLDFDAPGVISEWYQKLYVVRNEIVHSGRTHITGEDAYAAYDAYLAARNYISDKLLEHGYLNENKKADLSPFKKNLKGSIDGDKLLEHMKEKGFIEEHMEVKKVGPAE
ncbi:hypothetical protein SAMN05428981_102463 [Bacillus sp. OV194]|nr:hypothetical protein SAMN05428981_102463 [Bacillus sp. OV194]